MLLSIGIENFRCIRSATLELHPSINGISGPNASGKTSLLEAIFFLAHGRSFRSPVRVELLSKGADRLRVVAKLEQGTAGIEFDGSVSQLKLGGEQAAAWQIGMAIPVQIIDPSVHRLLEEGSSRRRRLMDWGVFHVKPEFIHVWRKYQRTLAQRNALLQAGASESKLRVWSDLLIASAEPLHTQRQDYVTALTGVFQKIAKELLGEDATLLYRRGWSASADLSEALTQSREREIRQRTTVVGPHRADLEVQCAGILARKRVSRGQQKLLASALMLSQIQLRAEVQPAPVCLMMDDPAAELDVDNLGKLFDVVKRLPSQIVLTSLDRKHIDAIGAQRSFHVEQGIFRPVL